MEWLHSLGNGVFEHKWVWITILAVILVAAIIEKFFNRSPNHYGEQNDYDPQQEDYYDEILRRMKDHDDEESVRLSASVDEMFRRYR